MTEISKVDSSIDQNQEDIWNFAFGSNLHPEKLKGRANLKVKECFPGKLKDWRLAFNLRGISWLEPSMAGVEPAPGDEVHGVLLRMSPEEFRKLVLSEGENHAYRQVEVEVETYHGTKQKALAFSALDSRKMPEDKPPTLRYLELIRTGARLRGLAPDYISRLDSLEHFEKGPLTQLISHLLFDMMMFFGSIGKPQIASRLFRSLRWIDGSFFPGSLKWLLNITILTPA
ncbi:MAG: gamma-glutamylcyclotransferase family protein, partial [SAR324 cluster bacterium]|nr:gamma-glutamylcyclotransferase family protein [SAR324 cluster bacterium]